MAGIEAATKIETSYIAAPRSFCSEHPLERSLEVKGGTALYPLRCTLLREHVYTSYTKVREREREGGKEGGSFLFCVEEGEWAGVEDGVRVVLALSRTATLLRVTPHLPRGYRQNS